MLRGLHLLADALVSAVVGVGRASVVGGHLVVSGEIHVRRNDHPPCAEIFELGRIDDNLIMIYEYC